jgi:hypothetical protein
MPEPCACVEESARASRQLLPEHDIEAIREAFAVLPTSTRQTCEERQGTSVTGVGVGRGGTSSAAIPDVGSE